MTAALTGLTAIVDKLQQPSAGRSQYADEVALLQDRELSSTQTRKDVATLVRLVQEPSDALSQIDTRWFASPMVLHSLAENAKADPKDLEAMAAKIRAAAKKALVAMGVSRVWRV